MITSLTRSTLGPALLCASAVVAGVAVVLLIAATSPEGSVDAVRGTLARVGVLWPALHKLPERDRYAVVTAAATCEVYRLPAGVPREQLVACLRDGARKHDQQHNQDTIASRLEVLLENTGRHP